MTSFPVAKGQRYDWRSSVTIGLHTDAGEKNNLLSPSVGKLISHSRKHPVNSKSPVPYDCASRFYVNPFCRLTSRHTIFRFVRLSRRLFLHSIVNKSQLLSRVILSVSLHGILFLSDAVSNVSWIFFDAYRGTDILWSQIRLDCSVVLLLQFFFWPKPRPHQQQCWSNIVECYKLNDSFDSVECCFDIVAVFGNNVERNFVLSAASQGCLCGYCTKCHE